jgi:hypothetical protein
MIMFFPPELQRKLDSSEDQNNEITEEKRILVRSGCCGDVIELCSQDSLTLVDFTRKHKEITVLTSAK